MHQNSAWKTLKRMWASWFVSDFPSATESVLHGLTLRLLEPHAQCGHGKSVRCCHYLGGQIGVTVNTRAPVPCSVGSNPGFDTINVGLFINKPSII